MKWLSRPLWLLAWSFWAWLGWGLYRELPRDAGPVVLKLPIGDEDKYLGLLPDCRLAAFATESSPARPIAIRLWNAATGEMVSQYDGPIQQVGAEDYAPCLAHGVLVATQRPELAGRPATKNMSILNLTNGDWIDIGVDRQEEVRFAPSAPLVMAFRRRGKAELKDDAQVDVEDGESDDRWRVVVLDLRDGRRLLAIAAAQAGQPKRRLNGDPFFIGDEQIGVPTKLLRGEDETRTSADDRLEVWSLKNPSDEPQVFPGVKIEFSASGSRAERIAWGDPDYEPSTVEVFDLRQRASVFSWPPVEERELIPGGLGGAWREPVLADDGATVLDVSGGKLWRIADGRLLWSERKDDLVTRAWPNGMFQIIEKWPPVAWLWPKNMETVAFRHISNGKVLFRRWEWIPEIEWIDFKNQLVLDNEGRVYPYPGVANWPLLALCQTILALPLVLLWAALRWRRRRRMRLASVEP